VKLFHDARINIVVFAVVKPVREIPEKADGRALSEKLTVLEYLFMILNKDEK